MGDHPMSNTRDVQFLVVDCTSPYNVILGRPSFNSLGAIVSTVHLCVKFQVHDNQMATVHSDQTEARRCYNESLKIRSKNTPQSELPRESFNVSNISYTVNLDPREDLWEGPSPTDDLEKVILVDNDNHYTYISHSLFAGTKKHIINILRRNTDLFAWTSADMPGIDPNFICHRLQIDPKVRLIAQKKQNLGDEKMSACLEETHKLLKARFIRELCFTTWLSNVVMVRKASGATYQRLMDKVFNKQIGRNLEVYVDDMIVKTTQYREHGADLKEVFRQIRKHNMRLNPEKCAFG
ncbi:uncharacterized protein [Arachis hypogaea]|uniref:uncharacterized protein n=1 Tax=Arachis hypogaea TaxID=3818 RepID=UPI003B21E16E